jgi:uncharacterized protein YyaL (SSP411 family)
MTRNQVIFTVLIAASLSPSCSSNRSAEQIRADSLARAKKENKQVFLLFTVPAASWCEVFEAYHADPRVKRIIGDHFIVAKIDAIETPDGDLMYQAYGGDNTFPSFALLDAQGIMLANSGEAAQNVGFPTSSEEVERYFAALKTACPKLSEEEIEVLREKLAEFRPKESSEESEVKPAPSAGAPECRRSPRTAARSV